MEHGIDNVVEEHHDTADAALASAKAQWCSYVLYTMSSTRELSEISSGGLGFAHATIRRYAASRPGCHLNVAAVETAASTSEAGPFGLLGSAIATLTGK